MVQQFEPGASSRRATGGVQATFIIKFSELKWEYLKLPNSSPLTWTYFVIRPAGSICALARAQTVPTTGSRLHLQGLLICRPWKGPGNEDLSVWDAFQSSTPKWYRPCKQILEMADAYAVALMVCLNWDSEQHCQWTRLKNVFITDMTYCDVCYIRQAGVASVQKTKLNYFISWKSSP